MNMPFNHLLIIILISFCCSHSHAQTALSDSVVTDIDGNIYQIVKIGSQWWMAENLRVTHYRNGDPVPCPTSDFDWDQPTGAYCYYENDSSNVNEYGLLYNWFAVNDSRGLAPAGWHVPTDAEWQQLVDFLGGAEGAGAFLKEGKSDTLNFKAKFAGYRYNHGTFDGLGINAYFWSSTESNSGNAWYRYLYKGNSNVYRDDSGWKQAGYSVRCVKDE